jgi:hypothetical protein
MNELRLEIVFANPLQVTEVDPPVAIRSLMTVRFNEFSITAEGNVMYTLPVDHTVQMKVAYVDAKGNPATIDGDVSWASSDEAIATVSVDSADSSIVRVTPAAVGQVQITAACDADLGAGVRELITIADISIVAGEAVAGTISPVGEPEPAGTKTAAKK